MVTWLPAQRRPQTRHFIHKVRLRSLASPLQGMVIQGCLHRAGDSMGISVGGVEQVRSSSGVFQFRLATTVSASTGALTFTSPVLTYPQINDTSADHQYVFAVSELAADRTRYPRPCWGPMRPFPL